MSDPGQARDHAMLRQFGLLNDGGLAEYPHFRPIGPIMQPKRLPLGPALPASLLLAACGVVLMLLGILTASRFAFGTMLLCAGVFLGSALSMAMVWLLETGRLS